VAGGLTSFLPSPPSLQSWTWEHGVPAKGLFWCWHLSSLHGLPHPRDNAVQEAPGNSTAVPRRRRRKAQRAAWRPYLGATLGPSMLGQQGTACPPPGDSPPPPQPCPRTRLSSRVKSFLRQLTPLPGEEMITSFF